MHNITIRRHLKLKYSLFWIKQAFVTFREKPLQFMMLEIFTLLLTFLPFLGAFLAPLLMARFMYCANKVETNQAFKISEVFKDLFNNRLVLRLAFLNFCLNTIISLAQYLVETMFNNSTSMAPSFFLFVLSIPTLMISISMWLSPAICLFNDDVEPKSAMWLSFKVCFFNANILVFLAFSILIGGISLVAVLPISLALFKLWDAFHNVYIMIPLGLIAGFIWILWFAILNITTYYVYKIVYTRNSKFIS